MDGVKNMVFQKLKMNNELTEKEQQARKRVCLALDNIDCIDSALILAEELFDYVGGVKVGKELNQIAVNKGRNIIRELYEKDIKIFLDLKLHDTPNTVFKSAYRCSVPGVNIFNVHIAGGEEMCKKAIEGSYEGVNIHGIKRPKVIGVTVLTSLDDNDLAEQGYGLSYDDLVMRRTEQAIKWGLDGIVCPANKAGELEKKFGSDIIYVTPGIKWKEKKGKGQKQLYTPGMAVSDCSNSILVIGSAITKADDRKEIAYEILQDMARFF